MVQFKTNPAIGILGYGTIGQAVRKLYRESCFGEPAVKNRKTKRNDFDYNVEMDVLNVCLLYNERFIDYVIREIEATRARLTIIHSAVAPLTTKAIRQSVRRPVVHSPFRGSHRYPRKSLLSFVKYIGAENLTDAKMAKDHMKFLGYKRRPIVYMPAVTTELNKLISTSYFGVCIAFTNYVSKLCDIYRIPFSSFENFNKTYNWGFGRLGLRKFSRPTLVPSNGEIGGNNVVPNAKILRRSLKSKLLDSILETK